MNLYNSIFVRGSREADYDFLTKVAAQSYVDSEFKLYRPSIQVISMYIETRKATNVLWGRQEK